MNKQAEEMTGEITQDKSGKPKKKKSVLMWVLDILVPIVAIGVFLYSGWNIWEIQSEYDVAVKEYKQLEKLVQIQDLSQGMDTDTGFPSVEIDFEALKEINPDVVGWLYIPVLDLSYPVVQGEDNDHYLHNTYDGTPNSSGSIFLDSQSRPDQRDRNTFVYGHNMKNGSMFGCLKRFRKEEGLCDQDPYIYFFAPGAGYKYRIYAYYVTRVGSDTYYNMYTDEQYDTYQNYVLNCSEYENGKEVDLSGREDLLTLSTCSGSGTGNRMITHGILVSSYSID